MKHVPEQVWANLGSRVWGGDVMGSREGWVMGKMIRWYWYMLNFIPIAATPLRLVPMT